MRSLFVRLALPLLAALICAAPAAADTLPQPPVVPIAWKACEAGVPVVLTCATLSVPLNYADPAGERVSIALMRRATTRIGPGALAPILLNPGGPGGSGLELLEGIYRDDAVSVLNANHDLIAFDPRGVGASTRVECGTAATKQLLGSAEEIAFTPRAFKLRLKKFIAGCQKTSGKLLPFLGTADVARDMEQIRAGLAVPKIDFLGYSYGTFLGATYAAMFPDSVNHFVLDGAIDPDQYANHPLLDDLHGGKGNQLELKRFTAYAHRKWRFGRKSGLTTYRQMMRSLARHPQRVHGLGKLRYITAADLKGVVVELMAVRNAWPALGSYLKALEEGDFQTFGRLLQLFASSGDPNGILVPLLSNAGVDRAAVPSQLTAAYIRKARAIAPDYPDDSWAATLAAALWPTKTGRFAGPWVFPSAAGRVPILVIGNTYDPRTPYAGAVGLTKQLGNAVLLTLNGDGHTAFNGGNGPCIDDAVLKYFDFGTTPAVGTRCKRPASSDKQ